MGPQALPSMGPGSAFQPTRLSRSIAGNHHAEKLRLLGTLTAGIAHDMRNVLNGLYLRLQVLERLPPVASLPEVSGTLGQMRQDLQVGIQLLERVRTFGRPDHESHAAFVDLDNVVVEACVLASSRPMTNGGASVTIERQLSEPPPIVGWRAELVTAVLNLVLNAIDVTPPGGRVIVRTSPLGEGAWVEVEDQGPGISSDVESHMFEPFFTTKGSKGTGLGLCSVVECVERHGAELRVRNLPLRGASIGIFFP
jgi:signal transduction histidine kinase